MNLGGLRYYWCLLVWVLWVVVMFCGLFVIGVVWFWDLCYCFGW